jgi:hypothetical protein
LYLIRAETKQKLKENFIGRKIFDSASLKNLNVNIDNSTIYNSFLLYYQSKSDLWDIDDRSGVGNNFFFQVDILERPDGVLSTSKIGESEVNKIYVLEMLTSEYISKFFCTLIDLKKVGN